MTPAEWLDIETDYYFQRKKLGIRPLPVGVGGMLLPEVIEEMRQVLKTQLEREEKRLKNVKETRAKMREIMAAKRKKEQQMAQQEK
jgi:hypothetical protein